MMGNISNRILIFCRPGCAGVLTIRGMMPSNPCTIPLTMVENLSINAVLNLYENRPIQGEADAFCSPVFALPVAPAAGEPGRNVAAGISPDGPAG